MGASDSRSESRPEAPAVSRSSKSAAHDFSGRDDRVLRRRLRRCLLLRHFQRRDVVRLAGAEQRDFFDN